MSRRPIRIATTQQLERSVRQAGIEPFSLPELPSLDINRSLQHRLSVIAGPRIPSRST